MKILIAFYSKRGGTEKLAEAIKKELGSKGYLIDVEVIKPLKEHSFWGWWYTRMFEGECDIQPPKIKDVSNYDAICIGSPNWTRLSLPVARYIREIRGLKYKKIGFFATTALLPQIEWYILSAYFLDLTFANLINKKNGRIVCSLLLSSVFTRWGTQSKYGRQEVKKFCDKIATPIPSLRDYFLEQREINGARLLAVLLFLILISFFIFQITSSLIGFQIFPWRDFFYLIAIIFFADFTILTMLAGRIGIFWGKYITGMSLIVGLTIFNVFLTSFSARSILLEYILIFILISFFHDIKAVLFTGLITVLGYGFLYFFYPQREVLELGLDFNPSLDLTFLFLIVAAVGFITQNLQKSQINLLEAQDEIELARTALEIKVKARTRELKELSENLEEQVKERTKKLQEKMEELEKFNRLAVGRELKMIELKEEIKKLKKS